MPDPRSTDRSRAVLERDIALVRARRTRRWLIGGSAALTAGVAWLVSAVAPGHSFSAKPASAATPSPASSSAAATAPKMPPVAAPSSLGLAGPARPPAAAPPASSAPSQGDPSQSSGSSQAQAAPAPAPAPGGPVVSGGS